MSDWLLFPTSAGVLYVGGQIMALVFRLIEFWHAASRGEDAQATKGTGSSL